MSDTRHPAGRAGSRVPAAPDLCLHAERIAELVLVGLLVALAISVRLRGLTEQGLRFYDEGTYCRFGVTLLLGQGKTVFYKPGTALVMFLAFKLFGPVDCAGMLVSAFAGTATVVLAWCLVRRIAGRFAAAGTLAAYAAMPYMLFYHRSTMTEGNYLFLALASLVLVVLALERYAGKGEAGTGAALLCVAAGACGGFGFAVNAPAALIYALVVAGGLVHLRRRSAEPGRPAVYLAAHAAGFLCGWAVPRVLVAPYIPADHVETAPFVRLFNVLQFQPRLYWLGYLFAYAGPVVLVLAVVGAVRLWKERHRFRELLTVVGAGLLVFYAQTNMTWPRIYFPLVLPAGLMAGFGAARVVERFGRDAVRRWAIAAVLCGAMAGWGAWASRPILALRSGYWEARQFLLDDRCDCALMAHGWSIFSAFTGGRLIYAGEPLAAAFAPDAPPDKPDRTLRACADTYGATHLVLDYFFWKLLSPEARVRFAEYLRSHPPTKAVPNPVAGHYPTIAEDGDLTILDDPLARNIYIWRLRRP